MAKRIPYQMIFVEDPNFIPRVAESTEVGKAALSTAERVAQRARTLAPGSGRYRAAMEPKQFTRSTYGTKRARARVENMVMNPRYNPATAGTKPTAKYPKGKDWGPYYARWVEWKNHGGEQVLRRAAGLRPMRSRR